MVAKEELLSAFPAFFRVEGRKVAIFGSGAEAYAKARLMAKTSAEIAAYGENPDEDYRAFLAEHGASLVEAPFAAEQLDGAVLAFAATGEPGQDHLIADCARALSVPVNAVDQKEDCDFYTPALVARPPVAVAIGTEGAGPVLAQMIRAQIDTMLPRSLGPLARLAANLRDKVDANIPRGAARRAFWSRFFNGSVAGAVEKGRLLEAECLADEIISDGSAVSGHVALVGAGPGAEDLLTIRAHRLLMEADVIAYDALVPQAVVDMGRRDAERISVGKRKNCHSKSQNEINDLLVKLAKEGKRVVRLKSGDPLIFGRAGEEMAALRAAGVSYEVVPGITSASAAAADFGLPMTLRGVASTLVFTTGHDLNGDTLPDWAALAVRGATIAVYMGRSVAAKLGARLQEAGVPADTTIAVVENASRKNRRLFHGVLSELPQLEAREDLTGPVMVIIGDAVAGASLENSSALALNNNLVEEKFTGALHVR
ncbi:siroheme synthase CysG [Martelella radicis]|uniref:Uroporphyrin-III C-methyltransferase/precorrin-2 dehydrogenase/sirohydrochlorin ferrochelatase n=1 Tax=Martelella radicis TaxID=1397476 RepID=A0A7W6KFY5_9HYPH|nr:siroheme synthase CysG [Martelella radicis]MBB4120509.1 uroporphyrin-III C-methyltransferase/precorrin-2 dehydrogenase/sirohydrochlorin ferrochelatase [Martelella radicis]